MKKIAVLVVVFMMLVPSLAFAAEKNTSVFLDGKPLKFSNSILEESGTTLVPFRNLFEALGAVISFDPKTSTVKAVKGSTNVQLVLGQTVAFKNGEPIKLNVPAKSVKNVTYVPLRFVSQSFGYTITLKNKNIYLVSPPAPVNPTPTPPTTPTDPGSTPPTDPQPATPNKPAGTDGLLTVEQIGEYADRVVYIEVADSKGRVTSSGSGVIVSSDGDIVTNYHVIDGASSAKIYLNDKRTFTTKTLLNANEDRDLALLKIDATGLPFALIGDSSKLKLGESVVAIGSPLGFTNSLTSGLVSAPSRMVDGDEYIQISAPIDHGSSGGALFNMKGELVGITTAKIDSSANINLAIPSKDVQKFLSEPRTSSSLGQGQSTTAAAKPGTTTPSPTGDLSAEELEAYLNDNYDSLSFDGDALSFEWRVILSEDQSRFLVGGTMTDGEEWVNLMKAQEADETIIPSLIFYLSEELHNDLALSDILFALFLDVYFDTYPSGLPDEYIERDGSGYRFVYAFAYGVVDYEEGYFYFNMTPEDEDAEVRIPLD